MKKLSRRFFRENPVNTPSAVCISYATITGEVDLGLKKLYEDADKLQRQRADEIMRVTDTTELLKMARQPRTGVEKSSILERMLELEDEISDDLKRRLLTSQVDELIEVGIHFLAQAKRDNTKWILDNYESVRNRYTKSSLCIVLGFRATPEVVPFLLNQFEVMKDWEDSLWHGPVLALEQLDERFSLV